MILMFNVIPEKRDEFVNVVNSTLPDTRAYDGNFKVDVWIS